MSVSESFLQEYVKKTGLDIPEAPEVPIQGPSGIMNPMQQSAEVGEPIQGGSLAYAPAGTVQGPMQQFAEVGEPIQGETMEYILPGQGSLVWDQGWEVSSNDFAAGPAGL